MHLTIGRLAAEAGVNVETVRYYQRRGLLEEPEKPAGGVRRYGAAHLQRLDFIRRAQGMGFSLDEVRQLSELGRPGACGRTRSLASAKLELVRARLRELHALEVELERLVDECDRNPASEPCPAIAGFAAGAA